MEIINIYKDAEDSYYYSSKKWKRKDTLIMTNVSTDYAFEFCSHRNFGSQTTVTSKKAYNSKGKANNYWRKEFHAMINC